MPSKSLGNFIIFSIGLVLIVLVTFGLLTWLHIPTGNFLDWIVGTASFWWLMAIVTVPWDIYFTAKSVLDNAQESINKGITVNPEQQGYVRVVARRSLQIAIALHLLSAIGLYWLAAAGISAIGYIGSGAALLFTGLRPAIAFYQYLVFRLNHLDQTFKYPRQDILELRGRMNDIEQTLKALTNKLDENGRQHQSQLNTLRQDLSRLATAHEDLKNINEAAHQQLSRESQSAIAKLNEDSQFLNHAREIIRFFKSA